MLATKIVEVAKELNMCGYATYQLTDATFFDDITTLSSNNISGAKGIKHPVDVLLINEEIKKEDFDKYQYIPFEDEDTLSWGDPVPLDKNKRYLACVVDKNRKGEKCILLFEFNLNYNTWLNIGKLIKKM